MNFSSNGYSFFSFYNFVHISFLYLLLAVSCESGKYNVSTRNNGFLDRNLPQVGNVRGLWAPNRNKTGLLEKSDYTNQQDASFDRNVFESVQAKDDSRKAVSPSVAIANIRHHRSRKTFTRVTRTVRPPTSKLGSNAAEKADDEYKTETEFGNNPDLDFQDYQADGFEIHDSGQKNSAEKSLKNQNQDPTGIIYGIRLNDTINNARIKKNDTQKIQKIKNILFAQKLDYQNSSSASTTDNRSSSSPNQKKLGPRQRQRQRQRTLLQSADKQQEIASKEDAGRGDDRDDSRENSFGNSSSTNSNFSSSSSSFPSSSTSVVAHKRQKVKLAKKQLEERLKDETPIINDKHQATKDNSGVQSDDDFELAVSNYEYDRNNGYDDNEQDEIYTENQQVLDPYDGQGSNEDYLNVLQGNSSAGDKGVNDGAELDIVTRFLRFIEENNEENCTAGTDLKLGQGIVDSYAQERFRLEAEVAVNRANMLTRIWKYSPWSMDSEYLLHAGVISLVEFDDDIFAGGNCYDKYEYKNYTLFCPFAYREPEGNILVKDLAVEYKYLSNTSEFFYGARKNAERVIKNMSQFSRGFHQYPFNETAHYPERFLDEILNVTYEDGKWSEPYFDCGGGNIWMMTYTVPFFGFKNDTYFFKGTSGIDIDLRRVDIDQCYSNAGEINIFANSNKCKNATTKCVPIKGLGFRRGSYRCECERGFYFPNVTSTLKYFNGSLLEEEYENKFHSKSSHYDDEGVFECLPCPLDCETCEDDRPCVVTLNWVMRSAIMILQGAIILMLPMVALFTWKYSEVKVVRAASPVLLRFIVLGAFFIYCTTLVMYPTPSLISCTLRVWLREIGFSLAYGALMLKTWRISVIFRVRSAKAVKITDLDLMKRLGIIVAMFTALLVIRTLVSPPIAVVSYTAQDLKAWLCQSDWWDHSFTIMELSFLVWGIRLCIVVRKAPSEFNESKFISLAIYNEFLLSLFLNISMLFLQSPANPDLLYIIFFCHVQLTMTLLLCLIFGSKAYMVFRGHDKNTGSDELRIPNSKFINKSRSSGQSTTAAKQQQPTSGYNSIAGLHSSMNNSNASNTLASASVLEEFHRIYNQLEELKERNIKSGESQLVAKIIAMQEAADKIILSTTNCKHGRASGGGGLNENLLQQQLHQTLLGSGIGTETTICKTVSNSLLQIPNSSSSVCTTVTTSGNSSISPRKKSIVVLSNISEEELGIVPLSPPANSATTTQEPSLSTGSKDKSSDELNFPSARRPQESADKINILSSNNTISTNIGASEVNNDNVAEVAVLVSCHHRHSDDISPTSPSENEVQVGDEVYMDAIEEDEVQADAVEDDEGQMMYVQDEKCYWKKKLFNENKKTEDSSQRKYKDGEDQHGELIEYIDDDDDDDRVIEGARIPSNSPAVVMIKGRNDKFETDVEAKASSCSSSSSQNTKIEVLETKEKTKEAGDGKSTKNSKSTTKVILDLDDKSRFTEEITV